MDEPPPTGGPKTKAHFSKLLTDAGVPHAKTMKLDEIKKLCMEHHLIDTPKFTERDRLATLLDLANVTYPKKASAGILRDICVANGLEDPEFEEVIEYSTVKCGLQSAMSLGEEEYGQFNQHVEAFVERVSRMMRRASLALSFHITRQLRLGLPLDDLYNQKDTYWKDWMRVGLNDTFPTPAEPGCSVMLEVEEDGTVRVGIKDTALFVRESFQLVGPALDKLEPDSPMYFDQVLTYASRLLQTVVTNNAWVPIFKRLGRLAKIVVGRWRDAKLVGKKEMYADRLMTAVRSADPAMDTFPECARLWVKDVRTRLHVKEGVFVFDNHGHKTMTFEQAARFNMWMQTEFRRMEARGIKVMPVVNVGRQHVRLDTKTLNSLICSLFPNHKNVVALKELSRGINPDKVLLPQAPERGCSTAAQHRLAVKEHKALVEEIKAGSEYIEMMSAYLEHKATMTKMVETVKPVIPKAPRKPNPNKCSPEEMAVYKREKDAHERVVASMKAGCGEVADIKAKLDAARLEVASGVFGNIPKRKDWIFSGMVVTDCVAVSILYQRSVMRQVVAKTKKKAARVKAEEKIASTYDPNLTTVLDDVAVVGIDPGRSCLACVAYVFTDKNGVLRYKSWRLSRGQYYEKSGIMSAERRKAKQWASMKTGFTTLAKTTLKAVDEAEILEYLRLAGNISDAWWGLALLRRESRDALGAYMGKRSVLDRFFAKVHRYFRKEGKQVEIAYGEAGLTMNPTGKGEVAVPTGGTYKAAIREFGKDKVKPTDESCSTKTSWETGAVKGRVYMRADRTLSHTNEDKTPVVPENEKAAVMQLINDIAEKRRSTRGGGVSGSHEPFKPRGGQLRYPEVRGLRFCNETRKYVDRDLTAAMTIARLRVMEILGLGRPAPFVRNQNNDPTI